MTPDWNEHTYEQQFDSSLRRSPKSRPVPVTTNLRIMDEATAREVPSMRMPRPERRNTIWNPAKTLRCSRVCGQWGATTSPGNRQS